MEYFLDESLQKINNFLNLLCVKFFSSDEALPAINRQPVHFLGQDYTGETRIPMRQPAQEVSTMRNLILAAFAARALITAMVSVAFAGLRDTLGNSSTSGGLMGGGG